MPRDGDKKRDWRDEPLLGSAPAGILDQLIAELLQRVREAWDFRDAIVKLAPMDPSVFKRAWANELWVLLDGVIRLLDLARVVHETSEKKALPQPLIEIEQRVRAFEPKLKPVRDSLSAHYFDKLRGGLTARQYFKLDFDESTLERVDEAIEDDIECLLGWRDKNRDLIFQRLTDDDVRRKRRRKK